MNEIKIFFIIIGTFFMREQPSLVAENTLVSVDPIKKHVVIEQKNLISTSSEQDIRKSEELIKLKNKELNWVDELALLKNKQLTIHEQGGSVSISLSFDYENPNDLAVINIEHNDSQFSVFLEEKLEAKSGTYHIEEPRVLFKDNAPFSFSVGVFDEWLEPNSKPLKFNQEFINQPLVVKKSDSIKGNTFTQTSGPGKQNEKPNFIENGIALFFAEDQDFVLINETEEIEVSYLDNNVVLIPIKESNPKIKGLSLGDNYFVYQLEEFKDNMILQPADKSGNIQKEKAILYFSNGSKEDY